MISRERALKLADKITWDTYNDLLDEVPALDSDGAWIKFEDTFGAEVVTACLSLVRVPLDGGTA